MPVLRDAIKAVCNGHWFWRKTFGSRTGTRHVVHRSGSCSARHKGREARLLTHDRGVRTVASRWVPRRPNGDDQRRDADPFPRDQPFRWPALGATSGPANRTAGSNASAMLATWIRFVLRRGRSGDTVPAPARSMNPLRFRWRPFDSVSFDRPLIRFECSFPLGGDTGWRRLHPSGSGSVAL